MKSTYVIIAAIVVIVIIIGGFFAYISLSNSSSAPSPTPTPTSTPTPSSTAAPTTSPTPTSTASPSQTMSPTNSPSSTFMPSPTTLTVATTTSLHDTGLEDNGTGNIKDAFQAAYPWITINFVALGTGAAITRAETGDADMILVHSPSQELPFLTGGYGVDRKIVAYNFFVIVGPANDPAGISGMTNVSLALKHSIMLLNPAIQHTTLTFNGSLETIVQEQPLQNRIFGKPRVSIITL